MEPPKVFISYSWHPKENQIRVQSLADRLFSDGVHCIMDIYDLKDGQDKNKFMEQMINDPSVKKVLLICNKEYKEKADARKGGVGIESTIVSEEIYSNAEQTKFIPVVFEYDESGKPCVPVFVKSRMFIDLSSEEKYLEGYDKLLRDIYDKPLYKRPVLGKMPAYLNEDKPVFLPTSHKVSFIKDAILANSSNISALIEDYLAQFLNIIPTYKIEREGFDSKHFIEKIEEGIAQLTPLRDDFISFVESIAKTSYCSGDLFVDFIERYLQVLEDNDIDLSEGTQLDTLIYDHFRYFNYDWFLCLCSVLVKAERFDILHAIVKNHYCVIRKSISNMPEEKSFIRFQSFNYTLNKYKKQYNPGRISVVADTIYKNAIPIPFKDIVSTDVLLFYLSIIYPGKDEFQIVWYPDCSVYYRGVAVLPRMASRRYFEKAKVLFEVNTVDEYKEKVASLHVQGNIFDGLHMIPQIQKGLSIDNVSTID